MFLLFSAVLAVAALGFSAAPNGRHAAAAAGDAQADGSAEAQGIRADAEGDGLCVVWIGPEGCSGV